MARAGSANNRLDRTVLAVCAVASLVALVLPQPVREPVAGVLRRTLLAPMVMLQERAELSRRAFLTHDLLAQRRDSLALRAMDVTALQAENTRLRDLIGLGSRLQWGFVPAEALHGRGVRDEFGMTLSAGSRAGVQRLSPVVAPEGLVGVVDNVDPLMSHAMLWTHPDFRVSAMAVDGSAFGIVQARVETGPGKYLMEMRGVPFRTSIKPGTIIVSSGLGGVYPRGIPLGRVIGETKTSEMWAQTYLIRPAVFPSDVYSVMVLRPDRVAQGVGNVWVTAVAVESATKRIVVAGDSLARSAALAEAQARQAAQDSVRQDSLRRAGQPGQSAARPGIPPTVQPETQPRGHPTVPVRPPRRDTIGRDSADLPTTI